MAYFAPYIDEAGLHLPSYSDIRDQLMADAKGIYGQDIYLGNDSMDYQYISAVALKISDTYQALQLVYNNRGPGTAVGAALDGVVKLNGVTRKKASYSTCQVVLNCAAGATIENGVVKDRAGYSWDLPPLVDTHVEGKTTVTATCQTVGAITAQPGDINQIVTPTKGWYSVTNEVPAVPGQPVEFDSQLRARQAISTELPSQTLLEGTTAGIASVLGVARYKVYENDTNLTTTDGLPPHSITCVVEGGKDADIAEQIRMRKGPGGYTNGDVVVMVKDRYGQPIPIRFYRPVYVPIFVTVNLKALSGYTAPIAEQIKVAVVTYLNSLKIGDDLTISGLWGAVMATMPDLSNPVFSVSSLTAGKAANAMGVADIVTSFKEVVQGLPASVAVNVS